MIYEKEYTKEISFPLGGIGTGCIGLGGDGRLKEWEIFNHPQKGVGNGCSHIAIKAEFDGKVITKVLNGDMLKDYTGQYKRECNRGFGFGPDSDTMAAFPHFSDVKFCGEFPIATLYFKDENFPGTVILKAYNPMIPNDSKNSSIPAAFFEIEINNTTEKEIKYTIAFSLTSPFENAINKKVKIDGAESVMIVNDGAEKNDLRYGDLSVSVEGKDTFAQTYWYRGGWRDSITTFWNEFSASGILKDRMYDTSGTCDHCTVGKSLTIGKGEKESSRFLISWNIPNCQNNWSGENKSIWKNYYATIFENSSDTAEYCIKNWESLYSKTEAFKNALFESTLDSAVIDAVSATLSTLKTPTVLRLEDGSFYGWEGLNELVGSCEGSCQHVWSYAYALCFLFTDLERSMRDLEFDYCMAENGKTSFRLALPLGAERASFRACLDGQMLTVVKSWREWKISGDDEWLKKRWKDIKNILEYAWSDENPDKWDFDKDGVLEGRQHHTLDMELFGPSSWLEGIYLLALRAAAEMAEYMGEDEKKAEYTDLYDKGYKWTKENLFNGEYFEQKVDLSDKTILDQYEDAENYWNDETKEIKYQIGQGSEIDQMLAQWHSNILGLGDIFDKEQRKIACKNMFKNNYKASVREFANMWRVFVLNDEAATVICDYPDGKYKPTIPIPYCEEAMTGFEYSFAGLLISEGFVEEGLQAVKAIRNRYDGKKRNPWNEIECGSNYARSMSSFALIPLFAGFEFHLPKKYIGFNPILEGNFKTFWSLGTGWGMFEKDAKQAKISLADGYLNVDKIGLKFADKVTAVLVDGQNIAFTFENGVLHFENINAEKEIIINL